VVGENGCGAGRAGRGAEGIAAPRRPTSGAEARINFRTTSQRSKCCATQNHFASFRFRENSGLRACAASFGTRSPCGLPSGHCYRLLRYLNSARFGFQSEIHSVRHSLSILGERNVRRWVRLVAAVGAGTGEDQRPGFVGAGAGPVWRVAGAASKSWGVRFIVAGTVVAVRCMTEMPMAKVLNKIPLEHATKAVLLGQPSELRPVFPLAGAGVGAWSRDRRVKSGFRLPVFKGNDWSWTRRDAF
jgi:hypothetical protein